MPETKKSSSKVRYRIPPNTLAPEWDFDAYEKALLQASKEKVTSATLARQRIVVVSQKSNPVTMDKYWDTITKCTQDTWSFAGSLDVVHYGKAGREEQIRICEGGVLDGTLELPAEWLLRYYLIQETRWAHGISAFDTRYPNFAHATEVAHLFTGFGSTYVDGTPIRKVLFINFSKKAICY